MELQEIVLAGCQKWGLDITPEALRRMEQFAGLLIEKIG